MLALFFEPFALTFHFLLGLALFTKPLAFFALKLFLVGEFLTVVGGQRKLLLTQAPVVDGDVDIHHSSESLDRRRHFPQTLSGGIEFVWFQASNEVVGLGVIGPEEKFGEIPDQFSALWQRTVYLSIGASFDRTAVGFRH